MRTAFVFLLLLASCGPDKSKETARIYFPAERLILPGGFIDLCRAKTPDGWLVWHNHGIVWISDPSHQWKIK